MPRVTFVRRAQKPNPVVTAKDIKKAKSGKDPEAASYYHWAFMQGGRGGPKCYSKVHPKPSQLTRSEYLGTMYSHFEDLESMDKSDPEDFKEQLNDKASEILEFGQEQTEKKENMSPNLQDSPTGELLEERAEACETMATELEAAANEVEAQSDDVPEWDELTDGEDDKHKIHEGAAFTEKEWATRRTEIMTEIGEEALASVSQEIG